MDTIQWRIQNLCDGGGGGGVGAERTGPSQGRVLEGISMFPLPREARKLLEYLVYEASWFHMHHAVVALQYI